MALRNLKILKDSLIAKYQEFEGHDCVLPQPFKDYVKQIANCSIVYNDYSAIATSTSKPYPRTYIPNQWFYVALYFVDYIDEVNSYRSAAMEAFQKELSEANSNSEKEAVFVKLKSTDMKPHVEERFRSLNKYSEEEIDYLTTYVTNYDWWSGGKAICRGDSAVSPVLGMANVVNQNSTFIAEICKYLSSDRTAYYKLEYPEAICIHSKLAPYFVDVFNHLYKYENSMMAIFENLHPGQPRSVRYAFDKDGMRQTNFFIKGDDNFASARKGDFYEKPYRYNDENYYVSLELAKSRPDTKKEVSFDGLKLVIETLYPKYKLICENSTYIFIGPIQNRIMSNLPLQQIYYGAPGTGKSFEINDIIKKHAVVRTTFHPDSDYSTFVGAYKPIVEDVETRVVPVVINGGITMDQNNGTYKEKRITYKFVKQAFLKAYLGAWRKYGESKISATEPAPQFLVIEEINRGNCAQIFGDIFQLLDRDDSGFSSYPIEADADLQQAIAEAFEKEEDYMLPATLNVDDAVEDYISNYAETLSQDIMKGRVLLLPPNMYIWATMNTSDQSLFPIDSAFKRRWDWKYMPIDTRKENWCIKTANKEYSWSSFLELINDQINKTTHSEDKQLGFYFCKAKNGVINTDKFVSKVLFYIYNDVFKDYGLDREMFKGENNTTITFRDYYNADGSINNAIAEKFLDNLKVEVLNIENDTSNSADDIESDSDDAGKKEHKETLVAVTIDGERMSADDMTQFDLYLNAIKKLGVSKIAPLIESMKYRRKGSPMATQNPVQDLIDSDGYSYVETDGYYFVKGAQGYTLIRILEDLKKSLSLNIEIEYK